MVAVRQIFSLFVVMVRVSRIFVLSGFLIERDSNVKEGVDCVVRAEGGGGAMMGVEI